MHSTQNISGIEMLSNEMLDTIFQNLKPKDWVKISGVCKNWYLVVQEHAKNSNKKLKKNLNVIKELTPVSVSVRYADLLDERFNDNLKTIRRMVSQYFGKNVLQKMLKLTWLFSEKNVESLREQILKIPYDPNKPMFKVMVDNKFGIVRKYNLTDLCIFIFNNRFDFFSNNKEENYFIDIYKFSGKPYFVENEGKRRKVQALDIHLKWFSGPNKTVENLVFVTQIQSLQNAFNKMFSLGQKPIRFLAEHNELVFVKTNQFMLSLAK